MSELPPAPEPSRRDAAPPVARLEGPPPFTPVWLVPVLALLLAVVLAWQAWGARGLPVTVRFEEAHGLKAGDVLRYRGMVAGEVQSVELEPGLGGVTVQLLLQSDAADLARAGSRFWIVRPQLGLEGVAGLDTLVGDRYLGVLPGRGPTHDRFVGLPEPPIPDALEPGLDLVLEGDGRSGLSAGAPLTYRSLRVGSVLGVSLAGDARTVEVAVRVRESFADLVREGTRFWTTGGLEAELGLTGLTLAFESLPALMQGGIALATPPDAGAPVRTGHRFALVPRPEPAWLQWRPKVAIGHSLLPAGSPLPGIERARLSWVEGRLWDDEESREAWVLPLVGALLGPAELFTAPEDAHEGSVALEVAGESLALGAEALVAAPGLALYPVLPGKVTLWPREHQRVPEGPEDCVLVSDPGSAPAALAPGRFTVEEDGWHIDRAIPLDPRWHGAPVLGRKDGRLIGVTLLDDEDDARVVPLPRLLP